MQHSIAVGVIAAHGVLGRFSFDWIIHSPLGCIPLHTRKKKQKKLDEQIPNSYEVYRWNKKN